MASKFMGKDGFVWWHGVVEDRKDPLFLGRCKVRVLGWHTEDKNLISTKDLPWAYPLMPVISASQTEVGYSPTGPVEGTWVLGFFRDGEAAQEPVILGTIGGIPERAADSKKGFNDPRGAIKPNKITVWRGSEAADPDDSVADVPYKPQTLNLQLGSPVEITEYSKESKKTAALYPRASALNLPTTSKYARGIADVSTKLKPDLDKFETPDKLSSENPSGMTSIVTDKISKTSKFERTLRSSGLSISEPSTEYNAEYPYNHVYESESGHLIEMDDTTESERLHWYHRSGTFTEFFPKGTRVDRTHDDRYNMVSRNYKSIIGGDKLTDVDGNYEISAGGNYLTRFDGHGEIFSTSGGIRMFAGASRSMFANKLLPDFKVRIEPPPAAKPTTSLIPPGTIEIAAQNINLTSADKVTFRGRNISYEALKSTTRKTEGPLIEQVVGSATYNALSMVLDSAGELLIKSSGGNLVTNVAGAREETILNVGIPPSKTSKKTTAMTGKIVIESYDGVATGGIDLNVSPGGTLNQISMGAYATGGGITLTTASFPPQKITLDTQTLDMAASIEANLEAKMIKLVADATIELEAQIIKLNGSSDKVALGKKMMKAFNKHTHATDGPHTSKPLEKMTGNQVLSQKVKLS